MNSIMEDPLRFLENLKGAVAAQLGVKDEIETSIGALLELATSYRRGPKKPHVTSISKIDAVMQDPQNFLENLQGAVSANTDCRHAVEQLLRRLLDLATEYEKANTTKPGKRRRRGLRDPGGIIDRVSLSTALSAKLVKVGPTSIEELSEVIEDFCREGRLAQHPAPGEQGWEPLAIVPHVYYKLGSQKFGFVVTADGRLMVYKSAGGHWLPSMID